MIFILNTIYWSKTEYFLATIVCCFKTHRFHQSSLWRTEPYYYFMKQNFEVFAHCLGEYSLQLCYGRISVEQYEVITENSTTEKNSEQSYYQSYKKVSQYLLRMKEQIPGNYQCLILNASNRQKVLFVCFLRSTCMLHFLFIFIILILPQFLKLS